MSNDNWPRGIHTLAGSQKVVGTKQDRFAIARIAVCWLFSVAPFLGCRAESPAAFQSKNDGQDSEIKAAELSERSGSELDLAQGVVETKDQDSSSLDESYRQLILGTWQDEYQGKRTLTVREDGTATMVVQPNGLAAKLFAERMTFEEEWQVEAGRVTFLAVGGQPEGRVKLILKTMGDKAEHRIIQLTQEQMLLEDADGETTYDWRRVEDE